LDAQSVDHILKNVVLGRHFDIISERNGDLVLLKEDVKKLKEKLNIHEQLIEIKKNIELLRQRGNKR